MREHLRHTSSCVTITPSSRVLKWAVAMGLILIIASGIVGKYFAAVSGLG
jgi:hypothetical protein